MTDGLWRAILAILTTLALAHSVTAHASVTLTVSPLGGSPTPATAYIRADIVNCANPTVLGGAAVIPRSRRFPLSGLPSVTFTVEDNVSQIACDGNQLSYYTFTYVAGTVQTVLKSVELPPGGPFNLANLAAITVAPFSPGIVQGPSGAIGPAGPAGPNCSTDISTATACILANSFAVGAPNSAIQFNGSLAELHDIDAARGTYGPGANEGGGYWTVSKSLQLFKRNVTRGIKQGMSSFVYSSGAGDGGNYFYINSVPPGVLNGDDEAVVGLGVYANELQGNFTATIAATTGTGDTAPAFTGAGQQLNPPDQGTMLDLSLGTVSGTMTARSTTQENFLLTMPITVTGGGTSLPLTTAWGLANFSLSHIGTTNLYQTTTVTATPRQIGSATPAFVSGPAVLLSGLRHENVTLTVQPASGGTQQLTLACRYAYSGPVYIFQGGLAGQFMTWDGDVAFSGRYFPHVVAGSLDGSHILFAEYMEGAFRGGESALPQVGNSGADPAVPARAGVHFYPGAEITAVLTPFDTNPASVQLESNNIAWAAGHSVVGAPLNWWGGATTHFQTVTQTPAHTSYGQQGVQITAGGQGIGPAYVALRILGGNPDSYYTVGGGPLTKPAGITFDSFADVQPYRTWLSSRHPVDPISIDPAAAILSVSNGIQTYTGTAFTGSTTSGSNIVTLQRRSQYVASYVGLYPGDPISGPGIPSGARLGQRNNDTDWQMVTATGTAANATATATGVTITVQAARYHLFNNGSGGPNIDVDVQNNALRISNGGGMILDGPLVANGGINSTAYTTTVRDTLSTPTQSDTQAVNTESLQGLLAGSYVGPGAAKYSGNLQVVTGVTSSGGTTTTTTSTIHFTNGIATSVTTP